MKALPRDLLTSIGLLILRLGAGGYIVTHGWGKLQALVAGHFDFVGDPIGLGNTLSLILIVGAEFVCGLLVMLGLGTRVVALPLIFAMAVAAFVVQADAPWWISSDSASKEPALVYLITFLTLVFTGAGKFSIDGLIGKGRVKA